VTTEQKPASIRVFGILNIVLGGLAFGVPALYSDCEPRWLVATSALVAAAFIVSGAGLSNLRRWGHQLALCAACVALLTLLAGVCFEAVPHPDGGGGVSLLIAIFGAPYPMILLAFMGEESVVEAFALASAPPIPPARVVRAGTLNA
jgi:hypothetical protein